MNEREKEIRQQLMRDFPHYAAKCLRIRAKDGSIVPLILNRAQSYLHNRLEAQRSETGKVRALVLKGRQQGISTYIGGRFYHRVTHARGQRCFILTHEQGATDNLFGMVARYHENCPELVKPHTGASNAKELYFDRLESGYAVGTAGSKAVGRSQTVQLFHGSEAAFWPFADEHFAGVVQAVPDLPGTEVLLESTANGVSGEFFERWQQAEAGDGDYIPIFIPWFWQTEYSRETPPDFSLSDEEREYKDAYGLRNDQMLWRRVKISELKDDALFRQEYPATASEAFQNTGHDSFIPAQLVLKARKATVDAIGPLVMGVDPARFGDDGFCISLRQGRKVHWVERRQGLDIVEGANWVRQLIDKNKPSRVFIDVGGLGGGTIDVLKSWGSPYSKICRGVNFGSSPAQPVVTTETGDQVPGPLNRRAEMWSLSKDWLSEEAGSDIPDLDWLQGDACGPGYSYDVNQRLRLESKEKMRSRGLRSPDGWDSIVLTFAEPVAEASVQNLPSRSITARVQKAARAITRRRSR
jgi:hypothetical protein